MSWRRLRRVRRVVQALVFALWVVLLLVGLQRRAAFPLADVFFRFDPLIGLTTVLAGKVWVGRVALALVTVVVTVALGRVWCGWVCPLGTLLEWVSFKKARRRTRRLPAGLAMTKYLLLTAILAAALLGNLTLLVLDPLALLARAAGTAVIPGLNWGIVELERGLYDAGLGQGVVDVFEQVVRGRLLPSVQPAFQQAVPIFLLLLGVVLLSLLADRFWCRYLCPLGALLGLIARVSVLRPYATPGCARCQAAAGACRQGAIAVADVDDDAGTDGRGGEGGDAAGRGTGPPPVTVAPQECVVCLDCLVVTGEDGMRFGPRPRPAPRQSFDPGRRQFLTAAAGGVAGVLLLGAGWWNTTRSPALIRPPGVEDEEVFLASCVRCGQCLRVCPTSGLQPSFDEAGLAGLWTPVLKPRLGYCDYGCHACGQVCPAEAIPRLGLEEKRRRVLGLAAIDRDRCLPWAYGTACIVCQEVCPLPDKAIKVYGNGSGGGGGGYGGGQGGGQGADEGRGLQRPHVARDLCIGCGLCEYHCPVEGEAAVRVFG